MRPSVIVLAACLSCSAAVPAPRVMPACPAAEGRAAISRDGAWVILVLGDEVQLLSDRGQLVRRISTEVHHAVDAFFVADTHVIAIVGTDEGGWHHAELLSIPDGAPLAEASEIAAYDARTGVVVYFDPVPRGDAVHTYDAARRLRLPNGAPPTPWDNPDEEKPASPEDLHARALVNAALCK